jgi:TPR repeat protein
LATSKCPESLESIKLLETRVERGRDEFDSSEEYARAYLELGDCYMYGFRGWERDFEKACDMYFEVRTLGWCKLHTSFV